MTPVQVVALIAALARAFGLVVADVVAWARQRHPELAEAPPLDHEQEINDEIDRKRAEQDAGA